MSNWVFGVRYVQLASGEMKKYSTVLNNAPVLIAFSDIIEATKTAKQRWKSVAKTPHADIANSRKQCSSGREWCRVVTEQQSG